MNKPQRIDYQIDRYQLSEASETPRLVAQWQQVQDQSHDLALDAFARLRLALTTVDYVTSFELPFRLLLVRAPQDIARLQQEMPFHGRPVKINGQKRGKLYSLKRDVVAPDEFRYSRRFKVFRSGAEGGTEASYLAIVKAAESPRERLRLALTSGLFVTALDGLLFFGIQRIAADVEKLRKQGLAIKTASAEVYDSQTRTVRTVPGYSL